MDLDKFKIITEITEEITLEYLGVKMYNVLVALLYVVIVLGIFIIVKMNIRGGK